MPDESTPTSGGTSISPPEPSIPPPPPKSKDGKITYQYFLLALGVLGILIAILYFWIRQRRRRATRLNTRAHFPLPPGHDDGCEVAPAQWGAHYFHHQAPYRRYEAMLNDAGEAPPAYKAATEHKDKYSRVRVVETDVDAQGMEMDVLSSKERINNLSNQGTEALGLPTYDETYGKHMPKDSDRLIMPARSVTPTQRPLSIRSVLSHADTSAHERS